MTRWSVGNFFAVLVACAVAWVIVAFLCLCVGSSGPFGIPRDPRVFEIRREVVLVASLVGAALALAGVTYQALLGNPLADPYLLGVSSGAMLASYVWMLPAFSGIAAALAVGQHAMAFAGALAAVAIVLGIAGRRGRLEPVTVVLCGVIVNALCASIFLLINSIVKETPSLGGGPEMFLVGGLQSNLRRWQIALATAVIAGGFVALSYVAGWLNVGSMDESEAAALGVRVDRLRWAGLAVASLVTASAVAISGPIGFVGLICPHVGRLLVGPDVRRLLPVSTALGAILLASADAAARGLSSFGPVGTYLPVGIITSLLGGPFFLMLLLSRRRKDL
jgi:iron complex transport system permease protein